MPNADSPISHRSVASPVGPLMLAASDEAVVAIEFEVNRHPVRRTAAWREVGAAPHPLLDAAEAQLAEYFAGRRRQFELPLAPSGTPFQQRVWQALCEIPYGETWSYGELARHLGNAKAMRAVGAANGRNPVPIVIPCHRVIGTNGSLVGFGGGLPVKRQLLALERPSLWSEH
jgi:methylated-DNA-[protein]-cysteine S-methyltransferase